MTFQIQKKSSSKCIATDIDSSGMSVFWVNPEHADEWITREEAESFMARCKERYPKEDMEVVERKP